MRLAIALPLIVLFSNACGTDEMVIDPPPPPDDGDQPPEGYVRYRVDPITVEAGESGMWLQWVAPPFDRDLDVLDVIGWQSEGGHHAILYAINDEQPVGTTRDFLDTDQFSVRFLGGTGGEGTGSLRLPDGAVFRVKRGRSLALQTHYFNPTDAPIQGESYVDVKYDEVDHSRQVASMFVNLTLAINVTPGESTAQSSCVLPRDVKVLMAANHMHEWGAHALTTVRDSGGGEVDLVRDDVWEEEWATNPKLTSFTVAEPLMVAAGTTVTTHCAWRNDTGATIGFPDEMCVTLTFYLGDDDFACIDGSWMGL